MSDYERGYRDALEQAAQAAELTPNGAHPSDYAAAIHGLAPRITAPDDEALVETVAQALWEHGAMSFAPWCEADKIARQSYADEARAVLDAIREAGALR